MDFKIKLAGIAIGVQSLYDEVYALCKDYLTDETPSFSVTITPSDIAREQAQSIREAFYEHRQPIQFTESYLETLAVYRAIVERLIDYDVFLMHGSAVAVNGQGYLFTAASGVGKTTHTRLWLDHIPGAFVVNGDKPLFRLHDQTVDICGSPWAGKEGMNANTIVPLRAISVLERGAENTITLLPLLEAYPMLLQQCYRPGDAAALQKTMAFVRQLGERVKLCRLTCNMEPNAALVAYEGMR